MVLVKAAAVQDSTITIVDHNLSDVLVGVFVFRLGLSGCIVAEAVFAVILAAIDLQRTAFDNDVVVGWGWVSGPVD